jgi:hypothetical protein
MMIEKLKATARDVVLAAVAAFAGALSVALTGDISLPVLKAAAVAGGYAALRAAVAVIAAKLA